MPTLTPNPRIPLNLQTPLMLLSICIWGESRNCTFDAMMGVGHVITNRVKLKNWMGDSYKDVILKPYQFSSLNKNDPNYPKLLYPTKYDTEVVWSKCFEAAQNIFSGNFSDNTSGAIYYFSFPLTSPPTIWGNVTHCCDIDKLRFYK